MRYTSAVRSVYSVVIVSNLPKKGKKRPSVDTASSSSHAVPTK